MGLVYAEVGAPRMMGRIMGRLLICEPAQQSSAELAEYLLASRGAISTTTRQLLASNMIEKVAIPGDRSTYFRIQSSGWVDAMRRRMGSLTIMREVAERGLALLADESPARRARLQAFHDFYAWLEERLPALYDDWEAQHSSSD
jgi:hypothetical protein